MGNTMITTAMQTKHNQCKYKYNGDTMVTSAVMQDKATPMCYKYNGEHNDELYYTRQSYTDVS